MRRAVVRRTFACMLACSLWGCSGGSRSIPTPLTATATRGPAASATATFRITIPSRQAATAISHAPRYVSASTQSVIITLSRVNGAAYGGVPASIASNLTPSNPACGGVPLTCTIAAPAVAGSDLYNVVTYDTQQATASPTTPLGQVLSQASVTVTVVANQANVAPPLVLNGVATSLTLTGPTGDPHLLGNPTDGFRLVGNQPYTFTIAARDAGGNLIIDPGAPNYTVQASASALVVTPMTGTASAYAIRARRFSQTPVIVSVTASNSTATANVAFTTIQELWVANAYNSTVTGYSGQPPVQILADTITRSSGILGPTSIAFDDYGRMWIANYNNVTMFAGSTAAPADTITAGLSGPLALAFDSGGILWVANWTGSGTGTINSYAGTAQLPGSITNPDSSITSLWGPRSLAFDAAGNLWVANGGGNVQTVTVYSGTIQLGGSTISGVSAPWGLAFDGSGALWVASSSATPAINPYSGSSLIFGNTISSGLNLPAGIAFDASGDLWVANSSTGVNGSTITEFAGTSQITANTISAGINGPIGLTFAPPATLPVNPPPPHPSPPPAPVVATPSSAAFSVVGTGFQFVSVSQAGYFGDWTMTNTNPSVASATQSGASVVIRPVTVGTTTVRMTNTPGQYVDIPVSVIVSGAVVVSPSALSFTNVGPAYSQTVALSQANSSSQFTPFVFDSSVVSASVSGNTLTITPLNSGSTVVRVGGGSSQFADVSVGVTISNVGIHGKRRGSR